MKRILTLFLLFSFLIGCGPASTSPEPDSVSHTYTYSDASILNPERGFFTPYELPGSAGFSPLRTTGNTLAHLNINFDSWRETDIPQAVLAGLQVNFDDIRAGGVKAIVRFIYNLGPYPDTEPDASKAQILRHIEQLTPLLQTNTAVIAWLEAGFIGAWGEWHTSTNGLDNIQDKQEILNAILAAIPNRYVQVRYPANIIEMYPDPADAAKAYVAHHNDCFLSSDTDVGTYERDGVNTIVRDQAYLAELTRFTPMSGETCAPFPPRSECATAIQEMELLHFSAINEAYHKGILRSWDAGGCYEEISNRMGYRLSLTSADFNEQVRPGGILNLTVNLQNTGFASIINERPLYVVLVGQDAILPHKAKLELDPRTWQPGTSAFNVQLHIPSNADEGDYQLVLWLPDGYESLQDNPLYAIRFANENVWDEFAGYNILGMVNINNDAGGSYQRGKKFEVIESTSAVERGAASVLPVRPTAVFSSTELISNPHIKTEADNLSISFKFVGDPASYNGFQVLLDTDQDTTTGMPIENMGADFLLENDTLNAYSGSGSDWTWAPVEGELTFTNDKQTAQWTLPRSTLGNSSKMDVVFQLVDSNWNTAFVTPKITYILK